MQHLRSPRHFFVLVVTAAALSGVVTAPAQAQFPDGLWIELPNSHHGDSGQGGRPGWSRHLVGEDVSFYFSIQASDGFPDEWDAVLPIPVVVVVKDASGNVIWTTDYVMEYSPTSNSYVVHGPVFERGAYRWNLMTPWGWAAQEDVRFLVAMPDSFDHWPQP